MAKHVLSNYGFFFFDLTLHMVKKIWNINKNMFSSPSIFLLSNPNKFILFYYFW